MRHIELLVAIAIAVPVTAEARTFDTHVGGILAGCLGSWRGYLGSWAGETSVSRPSTDTTAMAAATPHDMQTMAGSLPPRHLAHGRPQLSVELGRGTRHLAPVHAVHQRRCMRNVMLAFVLVLGPGCSTTVDTKTFDLGPFLVPCSLGSGPSTCMFGTDERGEPLVLYQGIERFDFRWGESRRVTVRTEDVESPQEDESPTRLILVEQQLLGLSAPSDSFLLHFESGDGTLIEASTSPGTVKFGGAVFACEPALCTSLIDREDAFIVEAVFDAPVGAQATIRRAL
jgi:hypothetical protein